MTNLNEEQKIRYLKRSYSAVDGLWFMIVEDSFDFDKALEIDNEVMKYGRSSPKYRHGF